MPLQDPRFRGDDVFASISRGADNRFLYFRGAKNVFFTKRYEQTVKINREIADFFGNNLVVGCGHGNLEHNCGYCELRLLSCPPDDQRVQLCGKTAFVYPSGHPDEWSYTVIRPGHTPEERAIIAKGSITNALIIDEINSAVRSGCIDDVVVYNSALQTVLAFDEKYRKHISYELHYSLPRRYHTHHPKDVFYAIDSEEHIEPDLVADFKKPISKRVIPDKRFTFILLECMGPRPEDKDLFANIRCMLSENGVCAVAGAEEGLESAFLENNFQVEFHNGLLLASKTHQPTHLLDALDQHARNIIDNPSIISYQSSPTRPFI